jgi:hypothetical protein
MRYKKTINGITELESSLCIKKIDSNGKEWIVPKNPENTDYQEFLAWKAEGNTPEEADET